ncbi:MAG TPA: hypothetical protein VHN98_06365 [Acidimicrobiales bacterium]|nr:hypothetical protein [Acidimicrobiales bacterium]
MVVGGRRSFGGRHQGRWLSVALGLVVVASLAWVVPGGPAQAAAGPKPAGNLDQCANGGVGDPPVVCSGGAWVNGNLNANQAHYREGDSVPYRLRLSDLSLGSHAVTIEWDTTKSGMHATDYLTTVNRTETAADPCSGVAGCSTYTEFPIPTDPNVVNQIAGQLRLYGGTVTAASSYSLSGTYAGTSSTRLTLTFTAATANPVLAWGGHIASRIDWGANESAVSIPGSPYHMRFIDLDGTGGNEDRSLSAGAVLIAPDIVTSVSANQVAPGTAVTDTASLSGPLGAVAGSVRFSLCGPQATAAGCTTGDPTLAVVGTAAISNGTAVSPSVTLDPVATPATYCFLAEYLPSSGSPYIAGSHTNSTAECFTVAPTSVSITKSAVTSPVVSGNPIGFTIVVTNTSAVAINAVHVTDSLPSGYTWTIAPAVAGCSIASGVLTCDVATLAAGASVSVTVTAPTSNGTNCGAMGNTAGVAYTGQSAPQTATGIVTLLCSSIDITKDADQTVVYDGTATFTITVTNTGGTSLSNVAVTDPASTDCAKVIGTLAAGASTSYTCTQSHVLAGFTNTATASGSDGSNTVSDSDSAVVQVSRLTVAKTPADQTIAKGSSAAFSITVTNAGEVPLTNVAVADAATDACAKASAGIVVAPSPAGTLGVGQSSTYSCTATDVQSGFTNVASASASDGTNTLTASSSAVVHVASISITKTPDPQVVKSGGTATFTITVTNDGEVALSNVTVTDAATASCDRAIGSLAAGASAPAYTCSQAAVTADFTNSATATGYYDEAHTVTATDTAAVEVSSIAITKSPAHQIIPKGGTATFTVTVTNTSASVGLTNVVITDAIAPGCDATIASLAPGASHPVTCTLANVSETTTNIASVAAADGTGTPLTATSGPAVVDVSALRVDKTPASQTVVSGGTATFTVTVTNTGTVELTNIAVTDAVAPGCRASIPTLAAGATSSPITCAVAGVTSGFTNVAGASGSDSTPTPVIGSSGPALVKVANVAIAKTPELQKVTPGQVATFTITVTNTGEVALTDVTVADPISPVCDRTIGSLAAGASATYTCTTVVNGDFVNVAIVSATDDAEHTITASDTATVDALPLIAITKSPSTPALNHGGGVTYTYTVTTPGTEPLAGVVVTDDKCAPVTRSGGDTDGDNLLDPGETWTFTCTSTLAATTTNTATVTGTDATGNVASATAKATVTVVTPALTIDKTANPTSVNPGDTVTYTYVVRNTGDDALSNVVVNDDKCAPVTYQGGDTDGDGKLDTNEAWTYTCSQVITADNPRLTNVGTVTAKDRFGDLVQASDTATISVVLPEVIVRPPELPRTGAPVLKWSAVGLALLLLGIALALLGGHRPGRSS